MKYIKRHAESTVQQLSKMFGAILVAGPRQVGKTTMLKEITQNINYATLDDMIMLASAQEENGTLHPLEMKKHADPQKKDMYAFDLIDKIPGVKRGSGGIICMYDKLVTLKDSDRVIPINYL
jgi:predicted AAA+ superfamily ATPase